MIELTYYQLAGIALLLVPVLLSLYFANDEGDLGTCMGIMCVAYLYIGGAVMLITGVAA